MHTIKKALIVILFSVSCLSAVAIEVDKTATIADSKTTIMGINHISISVVDLDKMLKFYQNSTGFELIKREKVSGSQVADTLYGRVGIEYEVATLKAPNMLFELIEFAHNKSAEILTMPVQGPGMTHTCFQSPKSDSGYDKFVKQGAKILSRGDKPVDLGGYGVTYAYAYDPEGNMFEMEQLDGKLLTRSGYDNTWAELNYRMWMSQVALVTHDIHKLMSYYQKVLGFKPFRVGDYSNNKKMDAITNIDNLALQAGWFKMNKKSKVIEFWQFKNPKTNQNRKERNVSDLGYSFSLEVSDIQREYKRLLELGADIISEPQLLGEFWQVFVRDPDSNIYSLRQSINPDSTYSLKSFEAL